MTSLNGTYVFVTSDNAVGEIKALHPTLTVQEIQDMGQPGNQISFILRETGQGVYVSTRHSLTPKFDGEFDITFGAEKAWPVFPGPLLMTRPAANTIKELWRSRDMDVNVEFTFTGWGVTARTSTSTAGYVSTSVWEKQRVELTGHYMLKRHENAERMLKLPAAMVEKVLSYCALRITEQEDGVYTMVDYLGTGTEKVVNFRFDHEFDFTDAEFNLSATHLVTKDGENSVVYTMKDGKTGAVEVLRGEVTPEGFTWRTEADGVECCLEYVRVANVLGSWKRVVSSGMEAHLQAFGLNGEAVKKRIGEKVTTTFKHLGCGVWSLSTDSKLLPQDPVTFRFGEEVAFEISGIGAGTSLLSLTRDGIIGIKKMLGKTVTSTLKFSQNFVIHEEEVVGMPCSKATHIYTKV